MRRDKMTLAMVFLLPLVQLLLFGFAIQTEVKHIPTVVFDQSLTAESRALLDAFSASGYFDIEYVAGSFGDVNKMIDSGKAKVGIVFPPDFAASLNRGVPAQVQVLVDASDNMVANQAIAIANSIGLIKSQEILAQKVRLSGPPYDIRVRPWYNPDGITAYYMVPAILGTVVTMTMVLLTSMGIVRERERGTLEQLMVTPIKSIELMIGKIVPYILLGYIQITVALIIGVTVFRVPIRGSLLELYILTLFFITASPGSWYSHFQCGQNPDAGYADGLFRHAAEYSVVGFYVSPGCHASPDLLYQQFDSSHLLSGYHQGYCLKGDWLFLPGRAGYGPAGFYGGTVDS